MRQFPTESTSLPVALTLILLLAVYTSAGAVQTWRVATEGKATDDRGQFCGLCPEQSSTVKQAATFELPGAAVPLTTLVNMPSVNYQDAGNYFCFGPPPLAWCKDWSKARGESVLGLHRWTSKHDLTAHSFEETEGSAEVADSALGDMKIVWAGHAIGAPVPPGFKAKFRATGTLSATCGNQSTATASMDVDINLTPLGRAGGGFPPAVNAIQGSWTVSCPPVGADSGPFEIIVPMPGGLLVGDQYHYTIFFKNRVSANSIGLGSAEAEAKADFPNTADLFGESSEVPPVDFDFGVPDGPVAVGGDEPGTMMLYPNKPNPFSISTVIRYTVPRNGTDSGRVPVRLEIFKVDGRRVATLVDADQEPGDHVVTLERTVLTRTGPGVYLYRLTIGTDTSTRKLVFK